MMTTDTKFHCASDDQAADIGDMICRAVDDLAHASTPASVWSLMKRLAYGFGWQRMIAFDAHDGTVRAMKYGSTADVDADEPAEQWRPVLAGLQGLANAKPLSVAELSAMEGGASLAEHLESADFGDALIVPVVRLLDFKGVVVFAARADEAPELSPIMRSALHVLAHCVFDRLHALGREPKRRDANILSPREAECLRWAANGKTDNEIGAILSISPRTARFHIENAKKKLGVSTRIQAVAEALRLKAIAA